MLSLSLPQNVHLLTFEPWKDGTILIRFEHILERDEDLEYSNPVTFNFFDVFHSFNVYELRELTLAANQWLSETQRMTFTAESKNKSSSDEDLPLGRSISIVNENEAGPALEVSKHQQKRNRNHLGRRSEVDDDDFTITLKPMQIRTFVVTLEWKP